MEIVSPPLCLYMLRGLTTMNGALDSHRCLILELSNKILVFVKLILFAKPSTLSRGFEMCFRVNFKHFAVRPSNVEALFEGTCVIVLNISSGIIGQLRELRTFWSTEGMFKLAKKSLPSCCCSEHVFCAHN